MLSEVTDVFRAAQARRGLPRVRVNRGQRSTALYSARIKAPLSGVTMRAMMKPRSPPCKPWGFKGGRRGAVAKELREQCISEDYKGGKQKKLGRGSRSARTPTGPEEATREKRYRSSSLSLSLKCHTSVLGKCFYLRCIIEYSENTAHSASRSRNVS